MQRLSLRDRAVIGVLDIGTNKVVCLVAAWDAGVATADPAGTGTPALRIVGIGHQRSQGVKAGVITDLAEAEAAVRAAIAAAERMAGVTLERLHVAVTCGRLKSETFTASVEVDDGTVTRQDEVRLVRGARAYAERGGRAVVQLNTIQYSLDGVPGMRNPVGMAARRLSAALHAVTADESPLGNLLAVMDRCYVAPAGFVAAPAASALAVTSPEERRLGVTVVDIGAGAATLATFAEGQLRHVTAFPVGGSHISYDIARALHTPLIEAERIKALYGTLLTAQSDEHEGFSYPLTGDEEGARHHATKAGLSSVIRPRVQDLMGRVRGALAEGHATHGVAAQHVVLTGGTSELVGIAEFAADVVGLPVRCGRPLQISGMPLNAWGPAFSTVAGLLVAATSESATVGVSAETDAEVGYWERVGRWLRDGF